MIDSPSRRGNPTTGSRPRRGCDLSTQPGRDPGTLASEPRGLGDPRQVSCGPHGLRVSPARPAATPPAGPGLSDRRRPSDSGNRAGASLPAEGGWEPGGDGSRSRALLPSPSDHRPDSAAGRARPLALPQLPARGGCCRNLALPCSSLGSLGSKLSQAALTCSSLDAQALRWTSEGPGLFPWRD